MINKLKATIATLFLISTILACGREKAKEESANGTTQLAEVNMNKEQGEDPNNGQEESHRGHQESGGQDVNQANGIRPVHLSVLQYENLDIKVDTLPKKAFTGIVEANGELQVPPQHEATVTAVLGANVRSIKVIEGDRVRKGQVLAYLEHPQIMKLQTDYIRSYNQMQFLEKEYKRQKRLYEGEVGSGKEYQQILSDYQTAKGEVQGYEGQLKQLNLNPEKIRTEGLYDYMPLISPINGSIEKVKIQTGQYVQPQKALFEVVNNKHIHADLMVFEKDIYKVKEGQEVAFTVASAPGEILKATIYSVGQSFEEDPKAVHVHAEINQKKGHLIRGMYIHGRINTQNVKVNALPEEAIIDEGGNTYIFSAEKHQENGHTEWVFTPVEVKTGMEDNGWVEVKLLQSVKPGTQIAWNSAYYLISEMKKSQASHSH